MEVAGRSRVRRLADVVRWHARRVGEDLVEASHRLARGRENRRLRRDAGRTGGWPLPPDRLVHLVAGTTDLRWFLDAGKAAFESIEAAMARQGVSLAGLGTVLDFGCGAGRVIRHWPTEGPELRGCDYNPLLVRWCQENLRHATFAVNPAEGRLEYPDGAFGLVYALSVFTHLKEPAQRFWLGELTRLLRPGGFLLVTLHGRYYRAGLQPADRDRFDRGEMVVYGGDQEGTNACASFHPESWVRANFGASLEVVDYVEEGALGNPKQDLVLLRRPGTTTG